MDLQDTRQSLLQEARTGDTRAWQRLADLYRPLIAGWANRHTAVREDAEDLAQEILMQVCRHLPRFEHNGRLGAFRAWLRTLAVHCTHDFRSARQREPRGSGDSDVQRQLLELQDSDSALTRAWDREHDQFVLDRLLEKISGEFEPRSMQVFRRVALEGVEADVVARELNMTLGAVYTVKSRMLQRLRQLSEGLLDWEETDD